MFPVWNFPSSKCQDIKKELFKSRQDLEGQDKSLIELFEDYSEQKRMSRKVLTGFNWCSLVHLCSNLNDRDIRTFPAIAIAKLSV